MNKRLVFTGLFILLSLCAPAQTADSTAADSLGRIGDVGTGPVTMRRAADGEGMILEVAGFGITLGQMDEGPGRLGKSRRVRYYILDNFEFGFNRLSGVD